MTKEKQPTANAFVRKQQSWVLYMVETVQEKIAAREEELRAAGVPDERFDDFEDLLDLYDDELFYTRYHVELEKQRRHLRSKYFGEDFQ